LRWLRFTPLGHSNSTPNWTYFLGANSDKPSIAVLPFQNMSGDPEQEYFADGMVEDIITGLSRIKWLFVIARNSSFVYKGKAGRHPAGRRELGVRYVLEGGVRKAGSRLRITGQLIEAETGAHLWADKFDGSSHDFAADGLRRLRRRARGEPLLSALTYHSRQRHRTAVGRRGRARHRMGREGGLRLSPFDPWNFVATAFIAICNRAFPTRAF
jgi:TolB-like protein